MRGTFKMRLVSVGLAAVMLCGTFGACSNKDKTGLVGTEDKTPISFSFYNADGSEDPWSDPVALAITEATGVTLRTDYPVDGENSKIKLMIASGEYPDLIFAKGDGVLLIEAGALIDLTDLIEEYGSNIKKLYGDDFGRLKNNEEDPSIYQLSSTAVGNVVYETSGTVQLQWAVLKYNNYEIPYTLAQYEQQIKNYLAAYPEINGKKTLGLSLSCTDWHWYITLANPSGYVNGSPDNGQWIVDDDNNYETTYKHAAAGQYEYYSWLNRMYNEGILDPEFATQQHEDYLYKITEGRVLGLLDSSWDYGTAETLLKSVGAYERTYCGLPVTMDEDTECYALYDQGLSAGWGIAITKSCKDPVRLIKFIDWLCTDEAQILTNWGIEGVNYQIDSEGKRYVTEEEQQYKETDLNYSYKTGVSLHAYPFPRHGDGTLDETGDYYTTNSKESKIAEYNIEQKAAIAAWGVEMLTDIFPSAASFGRTSPYGAVYQWSQPAALNELTNELDAISWQYLVRLIICSENDFDTLWAEFQEALDAAGVSEGGSMLTELVRKKVEFWTMD